MYSRGRALARQPRGAVPAKRAEGCRDYAPTVYLGNCASIIPRGGAGATAGSLYCRGLFLDDLGLEVCLLNRDWGLGDLSGAPKFDGRRWRV